MSQNDVLFIVAHLSGILIGGGLVYDYMNRKYNRLRGQYLQLNNNYVDLLEKAKHVAQAGLLVANHLNAFLEGTPDVEPDDLKN